ncbi:PadR family transcriptional regulator [Alkalicoccus urumqiensis]|uniref:PadR family transcriptional regulator n=1 Tax=Alkalicoccus urumqiensis TaxID=1548213 RepID=A0A2P6MJJ9_ALKUR|nr:PadR family transcriptional regulator [Alkalicoccus urumqiensis]PRO66445.1 PadR family transcriptional regulator [Alkalicoccus urumqiensis]
MSYATEHLRRKYIPMSETAFYILLSLADEPRHGYGIIKYVERLTAGRLTLGSGTVYGTVTKMTRDQLLVVYAGGGRRKTYEITPAGAEILRLETERLKELYTNAAAHQEGSP